MCKWQIWGDVGKICVIRFLSNYEYFTSDHRVISMGFKRTCVEYIKVKNNKQIESVCVQVGRGVAILIKTLNKQKRKSILKKRLVMVMYNFAKKRGGGSVLPLPGSGAYDLYTQTRLLQIVSSCSVEQQPHQIKIHCLSKEHGSGL